jgi:hypothetical protein
MVSFYVETPSGFALECGWGAREIDDATWEVTSYDRGDVWGHLTDEKGRMRSQSQPLERER